MVDIVRDLHKWVPSEEDEIHERVPVIGDQKTIERGVESQFSVRNAYTETRRLQSVTLKCGTLSPKARYHK